MALILTLGLAAISYLILYFVIKAGVHDALVEVKTELDALKEKEKAREDKTEL